MKTVDAWRQQYAWTSGISNDQRRGGHNRTFGTRLCQCRRRGGLGLSWRPRCEAKKRPFGRDDNFKYMVTSCCAMFFLLDSRVGSEAARTTSDEHKFWQAWQSQKHILQHDSTRMAFRSWARNHGNQHHGSIYCCLDLERQSFLVKV